MKRSFLDALLESFTDLASWLIVLAIFFLVGALTNILMDAILPEKYAVLFSVCVGIWFSYTYGNRLVGDYLEYKRGTMIGKFALALALITGAVYTLFISVPLWAFIISILLVLILLMLILIAFK